MSQFKKKLILELNDNLKNSSEIVEKDPIFGLISDFQLIEDILNKKECNLKLLYFNRKKIHDILYKSKKIININEMQNTQLSNYFYLISLIEDNKYIINYGYNFDFIKNIYDKQLENEKNNKLKIILSIIILKLISNYKGTNNYEEAEDDTKIAEISNNIKSIINNCNMKDFDIDLNGMNENNINEKIKIYQIYSDIINKIILSDKIDDNKFVNNILIEELNLLDFQKIYITKNMFVELTKIFNENNDKIKKYIITDLKDFNNNYIINFYFILFKYILKLPIYIYYIPFLLKIKKTFHNLIKKNKDTTYYEEITNKEYFNYIYDFITDNEYYKVIDNKINKKKDQKSTKLTEGLPSKSNKTIDDDNSSKIIYKKINPNFNDKKSIPPCNDNIIINRQENKNNIYGQNLNPSKINLNQNIKETINDKVNESNKTKLSVITKNIIETNEIQTQKSKDNIVIPNYSNINSSSKKNNEVQLSESVWKLYNIPILYITKKNIIKFIKKNKFNYKDNNNKNISKDVVNFISDNSKGKDMLNDIKIAPNNNNELQTIKYIPIIRTQNPNRSNDDDKEYSIIKFKSIIKSLKEKRYLLKKWTMVI